jgi:hypothetical protein
MRDRKRAKKTAGMFVRFEEGTAKRVRSIAAAERRPASAQIRLLVEEALAVRSDEGRPA